MKLLWICAVIVITAAAQAPAPKEVPVTQEPSHHLVIENQYTRTYQVEVPVGKATLLHRHNHDYVYVVIGDAHISNEILGRPPRDQQVKDGDVNFAPGGFAHIARNIGTTPFRNVTIEVLRNTTKTICSVGNCVEHYTYGRGSGATTVLETDVLRVTKEELAPGGMIPRHRHDTDHMVVAISGLHLKNEVTGKGAVNIVQKAGDVVWVKGGFEHILTNVGKEPARFVAVEFR